MGAVWKCLEVSSKSCSQKDLEKSHHFNKKLIHYTPFLGFFITYLNLFVLKSLRSLIAFTVLQSFAST
jgi:hypothetical protein